MEAEAAEREAILTEYPRFNRCGSCYEIWRERGRGQIKPLQYDCPPTGDLRMAVLVQRRWEPYRAADTEIEKWRRERYS